MFENALTRTTRDPFASFMDRFFEDTLAGPIFRPGAEAAATQGWVPAVDIVETDGAFVATADLPGLGKDDIEVSVEDNVLTVSGERSFEHSTEDARHQRIERAHGSFRRSFSLPAGIDTAKVAAAFENGVLTVTIPKAEAAIARKIQIK